MSTASPPSLCRLPLYFPSADRTLFGWLQRPEAAVDRDGGIGVLICKPFGFEAICSHRSLRAFADAMAAAGLPSLCFDYGGTGDSGELAPEADQVAAWTQDVVAAAAELQRHTGVRRVCLLGFRLGVLLALRAARSHAALEAMIAIAPVLHGGRYLRELQMTQLAMASRRGVEPVQVAAVLATGATTVAGATGTTGASAGTAAGALEINGFALSAASVEALGAIDLTAPQRAPVQDLLVIDRSDVPLAQRWSDTVASLGARVRYEVLPGFAEMMMTTAYYAVTSQPMLAAARDWLTRSRADPVRRSDAGPRATASGSGTPPPPAAGTLAMRLPPREGAPAVELIERPVLFGGAPALFGVLTEPRALQAPTRAAILLNDGANPHVGSNRMSVTLARAWARRGYAVLRMDLAGLGDSDTRPGRPANEVFPAAALQDVGCALQLLRARYGARDVTLGGLCSGAYHALRAALAGLPVSRVLAVNPRDFLSRRGMNDDYLGLELVMTGPSVYRDRMASVAAWRKLLRGRVNLAHVAGIYARRCWLEVRSRLYALARALRLPLRGDLGWQLEQAVARGVQLVFLYSRGEAGVDALRILAGSSLRRLGARCRIHLIDGGDHTFSGGAARGVLEHVLTEELCAPDTQTALPLIGGDAPAAV